MSYLQRRISFLMDRMGKGHLLFPEEFLRSKEGERIRRDLAAVRRLPDGTVDIATCSSLVRCIAKSVYLLKRSVDIEEADEKEKRVAHPSAEAVSKAMKEYFQLLEEFFIEATGVKPHQFAVKETFDERIRREATKIAKKYHKSYAEYVPKIGDFHVNHTALMLGASRSVGGVKCVIGGSSRFTEAAFDGLRKFALYADTIFVPDPILPWIEVPRTEERFRQVKLLEACHNLLRLKPLINANLPYPAVVVFPSWEKQLELSDDETKDGISELVLGFFSHYLGSVFEDESEIAEYVAGSGREKFRKIVNRRKLFWPPGAESIPSLDDALEQYKKYLRIWRSRSWLKQLETLSPELVVLNGILERIAAQFHVRDNARTFYAHPLFWLPAHFHYFCLCSQASNKELKEIGLLRPKTLSSLQALLSPNMAWLGNIPIEDLARLREDNCNEEFRKRLATFIHELSTAELRNIDNVASQVARGIASLIAEHDKEARRMAQEYERKHFVTLGISILTVGALIYPWIAPYFGLPAALAPAGKYILDRISQCGKKRMLTHSLAGVLSYAKRKNN